MRNGKRLATDALAKALLLRKRLGIPLTESVSAIDSAERIEIEVRSVDLPSMEGIYVAGIEPKIILSSMRPQGRRMFTCAHEIGHHMFSHGDQFDELIAEKSAPRRNAVREYIADCFATYFLMPKATIDSGMKCRGFSYQSIDPIQAYTLASWLGVGYRTLINHLVYGLNSIPRDMANQLLKIEPRDIRQQLLGRTVTTQLHLIDSHWIGRAIDCEVGDYLMLPKETTAEGYQLVAIDGGHERSLMQATAPGIARVSSASAGWSAFVRISRRGYTGRACFRFEEEVNE